MEQYINKARLARGDYYDYSKVLAVNGGDMVTIICPKHGEFEQRLQSHIKGADCKKCVLDRKSELHRLPLSQFIERSNIIHDFKYDYSKVHYKNNRDRITIICPTHGEFNQFVSGHLTGYGCKKCYDESKLLTNDEFIRRARIKHGGYYDYSKTKYIYSLHKVTITCPKHGDFEQSAAAHMYGSKCPECSREERYLTVEQFIEKARSIHDSLYSYDNVIYEGARTKVRITCREHGDFEQTPNSHLKGNGCPICGVDSFRLTTELFIEKAKLIHGDKYDYSKVNYVECKIKVTIICPEHGEFEQIPNTHLKGGGCYKCGRDCLKMTTEEFVRRSVSIHKLKYSYVKVNYSDIRTKVLITCPAHGDFEQVPTVHLSGSGCPRCNASKGELKVEEILVSNNINHVKQYTIPEIVNRYRYDFYLPEYRALIEFQGIQHYQAVDFFGGEPVFNYTKQNDKIKRSMAKECRYTLIELDYLQFSCLSEDEFRKLVLKKLAMIGKK